MLFKIAILSKTYKLIKYLLITYTNVTDFINWIVQILRRELIQLRISVQDAGLIDPVELWDEG